MENEMATATKTAAANGHAKANGKTPRNRLPASSTGKATPLAERYAADRTHELVFPLASSPRGKQLLPRRNHPLAEAFVTHVREARKAGERWLEKGHARNCKCDFCSDAEKIAWLLNMLDGTLESSLIPFGDRLEGMLNMMREDGGQAAADGFLEIVRGEREPLAMG